jgi:CRISPR-associated protein Csy2
MKYYLLLPRLLVRGANALAGQLVVNAAPVMAVNLFAHNLGRETGQFPSGVAILHHHADMLGESFYRFEPQQRRGAAFIDKNDYPSGSQALAMQPTASFHWQVSLVLCFDHEPNQGAIKNFLPSARIAGGQVVDYETPKIFTAIKQLCDELKSGFWLIERPDLLQDEQGEVNDPLAALFAVLGRKASKADRSADTPEEAEAIPHSFSTAELEAEDDDDEEDDWPLAPIGAASAHKTPLPESWLQPALLGYAAISAFESRAGSREGLPHAYAEALYGLVQYVSLRQFPAHALPFWHMSWPQADVFTVHCPLID